MAPLSNEIRPVTSCCPPHIGPAVPEVNSVWFKLFIYDQVKNGPPSLLLVKGTRLRWLPKIFEVSKVKVKSAYEPSGPSGRAYPSFCGMKQLRIFSFYSPLDGMLVHRRGIPSLKFVHVGGERHCESSVLPKNTTQCPRSVLEPGPLDPETSALTMRPPRLHLFLR